MVAQRGRGVDDRGVTAREGDAAPAKKAESKSAAGSSERNRKLGFKEKHALETLPKTIAGLQKPIAEYQAALAAAPQFGSASCRASVCHFVSFYVCVVFLY